MALVLNDRVLETSTSTGTGTFTLAGAASGFQTFANGVGASNTTYYTIVNTSANEWEVGLGTLDATGAILTRTTVYKSSNSNNAVVFTAGTKNVFVTYPSTKSINYDASGNVAISNATVTGATITNTGNMTFSGTGLRFTGDFSNATVTNRLAFQTSTTNGATGAYFLPNGSSTASSVQATNNSDPTNASKILIATNGSTDVQLVSGINGTGTYLPLTFYNNGAEKARLAVSGGFSVGTTTDPGAGVISAANGFKFGTNTTAQTLPFSPTNIMVNFGTVNPVQSFNYTFADANATTSSKVSIVPTATSTGTLLALGTVTGGSSYTNGTYYNVALTGTQTVTISIAAPGVITLTNALPNGTPVTLTTTGALPTGLTAGVTYYVVNSSSLTCNLALTIGGAGITTSGSQSGVQSLLSTTGTGATASQVVVSGNAVTSVSLPTAAGAVVNGTISTAGSGYLPASGTATYLNVPLTGGAGVQAVATSVTVTNGAITAVVLPTTGAGFGYVAGNTLSASNTFLGGSGSSFVYTVSAVSSYGTGYSYGDSLFAAVANIGGSGSGFSVPVTLVSTGADELEMDGIKAAAYCGTNGLVTVYFDASPGYVAGGRNFAYTLG
jgi:hypothetical protein